MCLLMLGSSIVVICAGFFLLLLVIEGLLEAHDVTRYTTGQDFAQVAGARIRYRRLGTTHSGTTVVFLSGFSASIEQADQLQLGVA